MRFPYLCIQTTDQSMKRTLLMPLLMLLACVTHAAEFEIWQGVNIAHWLSQSNARGKERAGFFTERDVKDIYDMGFDHIRIPIDEEQMFHDDGSKDTEAFSLLHEALEWCMRHNLRAVVDLHILRSHYFNAKVKPLFTDISAQKTFYRCWELISGELHRYPNYAVAYELMNEPVADDPQQWNDVAEECYNTIRKLEKHRTIIIGSNRWQSYDMLKKLRVNSSDSNIILSFHYYQPMMLTHYATSWTEFKDYSGPVSYPGKIIPAGQYERLPEDIKQKFQWWNSQSFSRETIRQHFIEAVEAAKKQGLPLYCGEYGCIYNAPDDDRYRWLADINSLFAELNIPHTLWCYRENGFGIISDRGTDSKMLDILTMFGREQNLRH